MKVVGGAGDGGGGRAGVRLMAVALLMMMMVIAWAPTPTRAAADPRVDALSSVLREITGQLERINNVYINKLERELSESTAKISALEATVRSIADRAAAWDNIQNHMTVWTDQSRTMERKMDILNRCHEKQETWESRLNAVDALNHKLTALDKKINAMTRLEFKVEQVSERVEEVDSKINWVKKQMNAPETPIINEFAGRGLLSSLLNIETKLDNITSKITDGIQTGGDYASYKRTRQVYGSRFRQLRPTVEPEPGITFITDGEETCHLHPKDSRRLQDVSAKVDLVFDRITDPDYDYDLLVSHLPRAAPLTAQSLPPTSEPNGDPNEPSPEHLFARFWKSLFSPFKKINRRFRGFETQLASIHRSCNESASMEGYASGVGDVLQQKLRPLDQALREEMEETRVAVNDQASNIEKVSQAVSNTAYMSEQLLSEIKNQFQAHRIILQEKFDETRNMFLQYCAHGGGGSQGPWAPTYAPREPDYVPEEPSYPPREEPKMPPSRHPAPPAIPPTPPSSRNNWIQPPEIEPNIHTLQGERSFYRNRHRLAYKYHDRPRVKTGRTNRKSSKRRKSNSDIRDCSDLFKERLTMRTLYNFAPNQLPYTESGHDYYTRYCDMETSGGGWTVIQRRGMFGAPYENFTMSWKDYKVGFGDLNREFWWGNDNIQRLVHEQDMTIRFDLWDFKGNYAYAEYLNFSIAPEKDNYKLSVFGYKGNASDSFSAHNGYLFSTYDRDNDEAPECCPCAPAYGGGWWFYSCFESNLNGEYYINPEDNDYYRGIIWELWLGDYSLKATEIKVRPASFSNGGQDGGDPKKPGDPYPTPGHQDPNPTLAPELPLRQPIRRS
ncbi:uncharacterized protein LOC135219860 isoform X2 [Macrobrachium nipponense]|uniref:uncharacterized protein LOC135219860 isoform X2 n=1 Tax=Macrobrachium nipponense TaxID=159736 RepID=UPI0030C8A7A7